MSSRTNAFLLACGTALGATGCSTVEGVKQDASNLWGKATSAVSSSQPVRDIPQTQTVQAQPQAAQPVASGSMNPTLKENLDILAARQGKQINFEGQCSQQLNAAASGQRGPGALNNPHNVGSIPNQGTGVLQGVLNQATGGSSNILGRAANTLGSNAITTGNAIASQWSTICNSLGQTNLKAYRADSYGVGTPGYTQQWNALVPEMNRAVTLAINTQKGAQAMTQRDGINPVITDIGRTGLGKIYTPQSPGGVVGDAVNRVFRIK